MALLGIIEKNIIFYVPSQCPSFTDGFYVGEQMSVVNKSWC